MKRCHYATEEQYRKAKQHEYERYYASTALYPARRWTLGEMEALRNASVSDRELSKSLHRSIKSIQHKRANLKKQCDTVEE